MICTKASASQVVVMLALLCGCKQSQFGQAHFEELQKDCTETLACGSGALQGTAANAIQDCVHESSDKLDQTSVDRQQLFLDTVARCGQLQVCDYLSCTASDPNSGWAAAHAQLIAYDCQQSIGCRIAGGQAQATSAVNDCVSQESNTYNFGPAQQQTALEQKGVRCAGQQGCAWVNCK
jgi:hypothetical protein